MEVGVDIGEERAIEKRPETLMPYLGAVAIAALTIAAYWPAVNAKFIWDDENHFAQNPMMVRPGGLRELWVKEVFYYPLTSTSFWIERRLWDLRPTPYHQVNIVLHVVNALLLWKLLSALRIGGAWLSGAIFALHPVNAQSVAWVTELKNTQSGLFYLLALLAFIRFEQMARKKDYSFSLALFLLALLSKTSTVTFPFVLLILHGWLGKSWNPKSLFRFLPFFALSAGMGGLTIFFHRKQISTLRDWDETLPERVLLAARCAWFYLFKLMWPANLTFIYPRKPVGDRLGFDVVLLIGLMIGTALLLYWAHKRRSKNDLLYALAVFILSLFPVLNFFKMFFSRYSYVADHWQYLACMGIIAWISGVSSQIGIKMGRPATIPAALVLAILFVLTFMHVGIYHDPVTLWTHTLGKNPGAWIAHADLAVELTTQGKYDEAVEHERKALALKPDLAEAWLGLGMVEMNLGHYESAISNFQDALKIRPDYADAIANIGSTLLHMGQVEKAAEKFREALELQSEQASSHFNLANILVSQGKYEEAAAHFSAALRSDPANAVAHFNLANLLGAREKTDEAVAHYREAIRLNPKYLKAIINLGSVLARAGRLNEAVEQFSRAAELDPMNAWAHYNLGMVLKQMGRESEALPHMRMAERLNPSLVVPNVDFSPPSHQDTKKN